MMRTACAALVLALALPAVAEPLRISLEEKLLATVPAEHDQRLKVLEEGKVVERPPGLAPVWSPDGTRVAWIGTTDKASFAVVDGVKGEDSFETSGLVFSPDGKHVAWLAGAWTADNTACKWWVVLDGKKLGEFDLAGPPRFSPDSTKVAYWGNIGSRRTKEGFDAGGEWFVVTGESRGAKFPGPAEGYVFPAWYRTPPLFSPDSKTLAYIGHPPSDMDTVVTGDKTSAEFDSADLPAFSADGKQVAWGAVKEGPPNADPVVLYRGDEAQVTEGKWRAVVSGREGELFEAVDGLVFSPNGKSVAYRAKKDGHWLVVAGSACSAAFDTVGPPAFSADGMKVAFGARRGLELWWKVMDLK